MIRSACTVFAAAALAIFSACQPVDSTVETDPAPLPEELPAIDEADSQLESDLEILTEEPEPLPVDETVLAKLLRTHPELLEIDDLYRYGGERYFEGALDEAEESFYVLSEHIEQARTADPDSLALLYLDSMGRKVESFAAILAEDRFFSESYSPRSLTLEETYREMRAAYDIPKFLLPAPEVTTSQFERELLLVEHDRVEFWMKQFTGRLRRDYQKWLERKAQYGPILERILEEEELPKELVYLSMIESGFAPTIRSRAAAVGWWQFIRGTARNRGLVVDEWIDERADIELSTRAASRHLKMLYGMFGHWPLALAAYNAGEYRIQRAIGLQDDVDYWVLRLPRETRNYVPKFIAAARIGADPAAYGFEIPDPNPLEYDVVELDDAYSLDQLAKAGEISESDLKKLNPQLLFGATPPGRSPYSIRVPVGSGERLAEGAKAIPEDERLNWRRHRVRRGQTLGQLARQYRTSTRAIMELNGIRDARRVRAGRVLTIPYPRGVKAPEPQPTATAQTAPSRELRTGEKAIRYTVRSGDSLDAIARAHGISVASVRASSGVRGTRIFPGQELVLHVPESHAGAAPAAVTDQTHERREYHVKRGDTLIAIGRQFGVAVGDLLRWNDLPRSGRIRAGQKLTIWTPRTSR